MRRAPHGSNKGGARGETGKAACPQCERRPYHSASEAPDDLDGEEVIETPNIDGEEDHPEQKLDRQADQAQGCGTRSGGTAGSLLSSTPASELPSAWLDSGR